MKITWYGESGFRLESQGKSLLLDPYFSDALGKRREDRRRLISADPAWTEEPADYLLFTHCHIDHTDPETAAALLRAHPGLIMAGPPSSRALLPDAPVFFEMKAGDTAQLSPFRVTATPAVHSDRWAVGYTVEAEGKLLYFSGDTALLCGLQERVPKSPDVAFLCFNGGVGKNMEEADALRLAQAIAPRCVVPFHYGVLPGGAHPEAFLILLKQAGIPTHLCEIGKRWIL